MYKKRQLVDSRDRVHSRPMGSERDNEFGRSLPILDMEAKRRLEQVDERLSCAVCLGRYRDPRMLDCRHSFCKRCLVDVLTKRLWDPQFPLEDNQIQCPKCRIVTTLKLGGVDALPVNFDLKDVVELFEERHPAATPPSSLSPTTPPGDSVPSHLLCEQHQKGLEYFCKTCDELLCGYCHVQPIHRGHDVCLAKDVLEEELELLKTTCLEKAENMLLNMTVGVNEVTDMIESLKDKGESVKHHIQDEFQAIQDALTDRKELLFSTTDAIIQKKITILEHQGEKLKESKKELNQLVERVQRVLQRMDYSLLREKKKIVEEVSLAVNSAQLNERTPVENTKDGPDWYLPTTMRHNAMQYGAVFCKPSPSRFTASGEGLKKAFLGVEARFEIQARDKFSQRSYVSGNAIDVTIQGPNPSINTPYTIKEEEKGQYIVRYTPTQIGFHALVVMADGKLIVDGERTIVVFKKKDYLGLNMPYNRIPKQQIHPEVSTMRGVCTLPGDKIVFADAFCLRVVSPEGELLQTIGSFGNGPGQFNLPLGVAANKLGFIFVSDSTNHRVEKFASDGRFVLMFGTNGPKHGNFVYPEGIALLGEDKAYVADRGNNRIQVFLQKNGKFVTTFGKKGTGPGQLNAPRDLAIDTKLGRILVSDTGNCRIQAFTLDGKPLAQFGNPQNSQVGSVSLTFPYFIATDENGFVLVTETKSHYVSILTPRGMLVRHLGTQGDAPGQFRTPYGICLNSKGQVIVTDSSTHCIQIF